jgi:hypothetical protein
MKKFYDHILQGHEATKQMAYDTAAGLDWMEIETETTHYPDLSYVDTVNGVEIYYQVGSDSYLFAEEESEEMANGGSLDGYAYYPVEDGEGSWVVVKQKEGLPPEAVDKTKYKTKEAAESVAANHRTEKMTKLETGGQLKYESIPASVKKYMPEHQQKTVQESIGSFQDVIARLESQIDSLPKPRATEDVSKDDKTAYLHYFQGSSDWYILESIDEYDTAFSFVILNGDLQMAELGSSYIPEIVGSEVELDFHWTPTTIGDIIKEKTPKPAKQKEYQLGDTYSSDFDYEGLLVAIHALGNQPFDKETTRKLYESAVDVNYHGIAGSLSKILEAHEKSGGDYSNDSDMTLHAQKAIADAKTILESNFGLVIDEPKKSEDSFDEKPSESDFENESVSDFLSRLKTEHLPEGAKAKVEEILSHEGIADAKNDSPYFVMVKKHIEENYPEALTVEEPSVEPEVISEPEEPTNEEINQLISGLKVQIEYAESDEEKKELEQLVRGLQAMVE